MDLLSAHRAVLEKAIAGDLPDVITRTSEVPVKIFQELLEEGLVTAINASSMNQGTAYRHPKITLKGREYLTELNRKRDERSLRGRIKKYGLVFLGWLGGILSALLTAWLGKFF